jgi:hypothetical protein
MSGFLTTNGFISHPFGLNSGRNFDVLQRPDDRVPAIYSRRADATDSDVLWPRPSFPGAGFINGFGGLDAAHQAWEWNLDARGHRAPKVISGVTRDSAGAAIGSVTVQLFNTVTGLLVDTQVSDSGGNYRLYDPNNVACFVVAYLDTTTDLAGTTLNTLTGT